MKTIGFIAVALLLFLYGGSGAAWAQTEEETCSMTAVVCDKDDDGVPDECCMAEDVEDVVASDGSVYQAITEAGRDKDPCKGRTVSTDTNNDTILDSCCKPARRTADRKDFCHGQTTEAIDSSTGAIVCCTRQKI
ncbi:MAG: hypothetical protein IT572_01645 [Deltaproteobacteria bacterium]|nr:hypothetical protein [Deltaproteobacteria bacterium]